MGRSLPRSSPRTSEWAVPRVAGRFSDSETSWVLAGGSEGSFLCSLSSRFSGGGGGVGSLPRAWRRVGVPPAASVLKKFVRLASTFPSPPFGSSDFSMTRRPPRSALLPYSALFRSNLAVGSAPSGWPIFGFRNLLGARRGLRGQFFVQSE